jgi:plastocyanin
MLLACCALAPAAGCGSSSKSSASTATGSPGASALKLSATPRYASPSPSAPVQSGTVQVAYHYFTIKPDTLRVKVATTIKWTNYDSVEANVTSESGPQKFASGTLGEGHSFQVTLTKPGVIHYQCTLHPATMNGTIEVVS